MDERVLVTGSSGFLAGYIIPELLDRGYHVTGLDNLSKTGPGRRSYDSHDNYLPVVGDARDVRLLGRLLERCDQFIAGAALVGGVAYFHARPLDILAANDAITAAACHAGMRAAAHHRLRKVTWVSSSMVYESATEWPSAEGQEMEIPPPRSAYGLQKLAMERYARAAWEQYRLPYTIVRPFNCAGPGEDPRDGMAHVIPDLVARMLAGDEPLGILGDGRQIRHFTHGADLAKGICDAMAHPMAWNEDFNLASPQSTTVVKLADMIWQKIRPGTQTRIKPGPGYPHDVQRRSPDVAKAKRVLGWEAATPLDVTVDQVIDWVRGLG